MPSSPLRKGTVANTVAKLLRKKFPQYIEGKRSGFVVSYGRPEQAIVRHWQVRQPGEHHDRETEREMLLAYGILLCNRFRVEPQDTESRHPCLAVSPRPHNMPRARGMKRPSGQEPSGRGRVRLV